MIRPAVLDIVERIAALSTRAAREAALLDLEKYHRQGVEAFLILHFARMVCAAMPNRTHLAVIEQIPLHLVADVKARADNDIRAAEIIAASGRRKHGHA